MLNLIKFIKNPRVYFNNVINELKRNFVVDKQTKQFIKHNRKVWHDWVTQNSNKIILVDFYGVAETNIARSYFLNILARKCQAVIKSFGPPEKIPNHVLHKTYQSFNTSGHVITSLNKNQKRRQKAISQKIIAGLKTKEDVFNLKVLGVWIGIDVYETYLKKYNKPTVFLNDPKLFNLVEEGAGLVIFWQDYFSGNRVKAVVASHDCYLKFDVVCKVAYQVKVPVYFPNPIYLSFVKKPHGIHTYFRNYRKMFNKLSAKEKRQGINLAKKQIKRRLRGEVGVDMPYATKSAFKSANTKKRVLARSKNIKVLICTHCFYDNPHGLGKMSFVDFYEWLKFLGRISERTNYDWYLKTHPDPLPGTYKVINDVLKDFPKIKIVPHKTSHHQLAKEGLDFVLTVKGTVGHEYPLLDVQVINADYNPRIAYDFNWHAKSKKEYEKMLLNLGKLKKKKIDLDQVYEFYYMHHNYVYDDDLVFNSYEQMTKDLSMNERIGSKVFDYFLNQFNFKKHQKIIKTMKRFIDSGKHRHLSHGPEQ